MIILTQMPEFADWAANENHEIHVGGHKCKFEGVKPTAPRGSKFKANTTCSTRSVADYDCVFNFEVVKRSAKTITIKYHGDLKRCKIHTDENGDEFAYPLGRYSMCPVIRPAK
jgi:hypothetical protein